MQSMRIASNFTVVQPTVGLRSQAESRPPSESDVCKLF